jgi:hypothetical protein
MRAPNEAERQRRKADLDRRLRQAFVEGAEERSRRELGRGLTADELERVLRRYPGDLRQPQGGIAPGTCIVSPTE